MFWIALAVVLIALIVLGPDKLPEAAKKVGKVMGDLRKMSSGFQQEMKQAMDVEGLGDLKRTLSGTAAPTLPPLTPDPADPATATPAPSDAPVEIAATAPVDPTAPAPAAPMPPATYIPPSATAPSASPDLKSVPNDAANPPASSGHQGAA